MLIELMAIGVAEQPGLRPGNKQGQLLSAFGEQADFAKHGWAGSAHFAKSVQYKVGVLRSQSTCMQSKSPPLVYFPDESQTCPARAWSIASRHQLS